MLLSGPWYTFKIEPHALYTGAYQWHRSLAEIRRETAGTVECLFEHVPYAIHLSSEILEPLVGWREGGSCPFGPGSAPVLDIPAIRYPSVPLAAAQLDCRGHLASHFLRFVPRKRTSLTACRNRKHPYTRGRSVVNSEHLAYVGRIHLSALSPTESGHDRYVYLNIARLGCDHLAKDKHNAQRVALSWSDHFSEIVPREHFTTFLPSQSNLFRSYRAKTHE